jgi:hypothetical protein
MIGAKQIRAQSHGAARLLPVLSALPQAESATPMNHTSPIGTGHAPAPTRADRPARDDEDPDLAFIDSMLQDKDLLL